MEIQFLGLTVKENNWKCFEYRVTIGKEHTNYYTGIGHCYVGKKENERDIKASSSIEHDLLKSDRKLLHQLQNKSFSQKLIYIKFPSKSDIAECLLSDIQFGSESFNDFCDNLGLSNDSLKALDTYRACMETARKFKKSELVKYLTEEQKEDLGL